MPQLMENSANLTPYKRMKIRTALRGQINKPVELNRSGKPSQQKKVVVKTIVAEKHSWTKHIWRSSCILNSWYYRMQVAKWTINVLKLIRLQRSHDKFSSDSQIF